MGLPHFQRNNPNWITALGPNLDIALADCKTFFYIYDCKSAWIGAGAVQDAGFMRTHSWVSERGKDRFKGIGADCAVLASQAGAQAGSPILEKALHDVGYYFASTITFERVILAQQSTAGHWICIVYSLADGSRISRPAFTAKSSAQSGFLSESELTSFVKLVIQEDLSTSQSAVSKQVQAGGGAVFHESVRFLPAQHNAPG